MKEKITTFQIVIILAIAVFAAFCWYQYQKNEKEMIKIDACLKVCSEESSESTGLSRYLKDDDNECREGCREKYGISWEEYSKWKK